MFSCRTLTLSPSPSPPTPITESLPVTMALCVRASAVRPQVKAQATRKTPAVQKVAQAAAIGFSSLVLASGAAIADATVKLGADSGALVFDPDTVTIKAGESVTWVNNAGFPHNIVFDEDAIPVSGLDERPGSTSRENRMHGQRTPAMMGSQQALGCGSPCAPGSCANAGRMAQWLPRDLASGYPCHNGRAGSHRSGAAAHHHVCSSNSLAGSSDPAMQRSAAADRSEPDPLCVFFHPPSFLPSLQAGENAEALSNEDYLNAPGEKVTKTFKTAGEYSYYCEPHQGAGMRGTVKVQ